MSQVGFQCPSKINPNGGNNYNQTFSSNFCIQDCANQCLPASVLYHIQSKLSRDKHTGFYISVTSLLGCLRQLYLERTTDYFVEPSKCWYSIRGSILHHLLENPGLEAMATDMFKEIHNRAKAQNLTQDVIVPLIGELDHVIERISKLLPAKQIPNWEAETEYEYDTGLSVDETGVIVEGNRITQAIKKIRPLMLLGTIDVLRPETGEMYDYKTIGDKGIGIIKDGAKPDHIMQFNLYKLLVERGRPVGNKNYKPVKVNKITAFYMTMMQVVGTGKIMSEVTPWRLSDPPEHPNLIGTPELLELVVDTRLKKGKRKATATQDDYNLVENKKFKLSYAIPDVPLLDLDEVARFVKETVPLLHNGFTQGSTDATMIPPMCSLEMREWKCSSYCPDTIRNECDKINLTLGQKRIPDNNKHDILIESTEE